MEAQKTSSYVSSSSSTQKSKSGSGQNLITIVDENMSEVPAKLNNKVFVDGLAYSYNPPPGKLSLEEELIKFIHAWKVGRVMHVTKKNGQGFGYVALRSPNSVSVAINVLNGKKFMGRYLRVSIPKSASIDPEKNKTSLKAVTLNAERQVLISDLAKDTNPTVIREIIRHLAPQLESKIEAIKMTGKNRKAFLTLESETDVPGVISLLNGFSMLGRRIHAEPAEAPGTLVYSKRSYSPVATYEDSSIKKLSNNSSLPETKEHLIPLGLLGNSVARPSNILRQGSKATQSASTPAIGEVFNETNVYVGNLPSEVTEGDIREHFKACGPLLSCSIVQNSVSHLPLGIAHLRFLHASSATNAVQTLHESRLKNCTIRVEQGDKPNFTLSEKENDQEKVAKSDVSRLKPKSSKKAVSRKRERSLEIVPSQPRAKSKIHKSIPKGSKGK